MDSKEMVKLAVKAMEDKKAEDIRVIDISEISSIGDFFIIANGSNINQVKTIADFVDETLGRAGVVPKSSEGYKGGGWILLDYGDVIIHIFDRDNRIFYNLERIWKDGRDVDIATL
jgi:ribosome-associated protein